MRRPDERNTKQERDQKEIKEKNSLFPFWPFCCSSFVSRFCLIRYTDRYNPSSRRCFYPIVKKSASRNMRMKLKWKQRKKERKSVNTLPDWLTRRPTCIFGHKPTSTYSTTCASLFPLGFFWNQIVLFEVSFAFIVFAFFRIAVFSLILSFSLFSMMTDEEKWANFTAKEEQNVGRRSTDRTDERTKSRQQKFTNSIWIPKHPRIVSQQSLFVCVSGRRSSTKFF